jgi:hypothetical protein
VWAVSSDYYLTLGLTRAAGAREIARAYRRLARRYHPDVSGSPAATIELFLAVHEAYETLSDPARRARYDTQLRQQQRPPAWQQPRRASPTTSAQPRGRQANAPPARSVSPPLASKAATAVTLAAASIGLLPLSLVIAAVTDHGLIWIGIASLLALVGSTIARSLSVRELDRLWRWTATGGRATLSRSARARLTQRRIHLADDITLHVRRLVVVGIPIAFLIQR